jgi:hypothetical protein
VNADGTAGVLPGTLASSSAGDTPATLGACERGSGIGALSATVASLPDTETCLGNGPSCEVELGEINVAGSA